MFVEVIFVDVFLLLLYGLVHEVVRGGPRGSLRHPSNPPPSKACAKEKPFPGLTRKPHCAACEAAAEAHRRPPLAPPPPVVQYQLRDPGIQGSDQRNPMKINNKPAHTESNFGLDGSFSGKNYFARCLAPTDIPYQAMSGTSPTDAIRKSFR